MHELFPLLKDRADSLAPTLSGGQQQMVAIARALMSEPRLVIFDELSLGLAPTTVDSLFEVIAQLREWGMAIMLIEQNVYRALAVADRVCVLERGRISFAGSSGELQQRERLEEAYFGRHTGPTAAHQRRMEERMRKKVVLISAAVAIVAAISAATAVTAGTAARAGGDVTIGTSLPLTGSLWGAETRSRWNTRALSHLPRLRRTGVWRA